VESEEVDSFCERYLEVSNVVQVQCLNTFCTHFIPYTFLVLS